MIAGIATPRKAAYRNKISSPSRKNHNIIEPFFLQQIIKRIQKCFWLPQFPLLQTLNLLASSHIQRNKRSERKKMQHRQEKTLINLWASSILWISLHKPILFLTITFLHSWLFPFEAKHKNRSSFSVFELSFQEGLVSYKNWVNTFNIITIAIIILLSHAIFFHYISWSIILMKGVEIIETFCY